MHGVSQLQTISPRISGSQWSYDSGNIFPWQVFIQVPWKRFHKHEYQPLLHKSDCQYYYYSGDDELATQAFKLLSEFDDYSSIQMLNGSQGIELVSSEVMPTPTNKAWLILGTAQDGNGVKYPNDLMPWTAYPGELTASLKNMTDFDGNMKCLIKATKNGFSITVKTINS